MRSVKLKICGMKHNAAEVATVQPDYLGFIFYEPSPRNFSGSIPQLPPEIKKVGVFVNADMGFISEKIAEHKLDVVQLHGDESPEFCGAIKDVDVWKVFGVKDSFDFNRLNPFKKLVDCFLFDTLGRTKGGNGYKFNWKILNDYNLDIPIVLSGGIGLEELNEIHEILKTELPITIIDINSRFEIEPGLKDTSKIKEFADGLQCK